jgi:hypothetical protein
MEANHYFTPTTTQFPLWRFLTQPVFSPAQVILNPLQFWHRYKVQFLERCWENDPVQFLEQCWQQEFELKDSHLQSLQES